MVAPPVSPLVLCLATASGLVIAQASPSIGQETQLGVAALLILLIVREVLAFLLKTRKPTTAEAIASAADIMELRMRSIATQEALKNLREDELAWHSRQIEILEDVRDILGKK